MLRKIEEHILEYSYINPNEDLFSDCMGDDSDLEEQKLINVAANKQELRKFKEVAANYHLAFNIMTWKQLRENKWYKKKLKLRSLIPPKIQNPLQKIRFLDHVFPLDSDIFQNYNSLSPKEFRCFTDVYDYKRVRMVTYDEEKKIFTVKMYERDFDRNMYNSNIASYNYYCDWLRSLGNKKA